MTAMVYFGIHYWLAANLILGLFNMLPFGPLDGLKVKDWSEGAFWVLIAIFAVPGLLWFTGNIDIMGWVEHLATIEYMGTRKWRGVLCDDVWIGSR